MLSVRPGLPLIKRVFNGAQFAICGYAAGGVYVWLGGAVGVPKVEAFDDLIGPSPRPPPCSCRSTSCSAHHVRLAANVSALEVPLRGLAQFLLSYSGYGTFGLLVAGLWATVQSISAVLVLLPLFVARWAFGQYHAQQRAYDATIAALSRRWRPRTTTPAGHCTRVSLARR